MRVELAVFDMVGTTVQAGDEVPAAFREAFLSVGVTLSHEELNRIRGRSKRDAIAELLSSHDATVAVDRDPNEVVYGRFQDSLRRAYRSQVRAVPGASAAFEFLMKEGVRVVLSTGLDREVAELLVQGLGWDAIGITGLVTGDDVARGRPAPDLIHAAMRMAGVTDPKAVLVAGDTASDLDASAAAEVGWSVGVLSGAHSRAQLEAHRHSVILENVGALPGWLTKIGALSPIGGGWR